MWHVNLNQASLDSEGIDSCCVQFGIHEISKPDWIVAWTKTSVYIRTSILHRHGNSMWFAKIDASTISLQWYCDRSQSQILSWIITFKAISTVAEAANRLLAGLPHWNVTCVVISMRPSTPNNNETSWGRSYSRNKQQRVLRFEGMANYGGR